MQEKNNKTRKYVILALLIALSAVLSYFDNLLCRTIFPGVIQIKIGFANIAIMLIIYNYRFLDGILCVVLKSLMVGLILGGGFITFIIGFSGSLVSFLAMYFAHRIFKDKKYMLFIGLIGGFTHPIGQLIAAIIIYGWRDFSASALFMAPIMLTSGIVTGTMIGLLSHQIDQRLNKKIPN